MSSAAPAHVAEVEALLGELEALDDGAARATALGVVQALLELYGAGLERIVEVIAEVDDGALAGALAEDDLVAHLLLLHGLHPVPVQQRVQEALDGVMPYLESHGGRVELVDVRDGVAHLRMEGSCSGCPSSQATLKLAIEDAIFAAAPDIGEVRAEGVAPAASALLQIGHVGGAPSVSPGTWATAGGMPQLATGGVLHKRICGQDVLFLRPNGRVYAYRPRCPSCDDALEAASLRGHELTCSGCGKRFDVLRAGRCLDAPALHMDPVPLLVDDDGLIRVAI